MFLNELMQVIPYTEIVNRSGLSADRLQVKLLCSDSRKADADSIFVCISGTLSDGHDYAAAAYARGCRIFVTEHKTELPDDTFVVITGDTRIALARLSAAFFGNPAEEMTVIGVTGTKGKTTSSLMIYHALNNSGIPTGYIGSNGICFGDYTYGTVNTTGLPSQIIPTLPPASFAATLSGFSLLPISVKKRGLPPHKNCSI